MVNSSTALPPEYWPCTSVPGLTLRAITSPSMSARSVYSWLTASADPPRRSCAFFLARSYSALALP